MIRKPLITKKTNTRSAKYDIWKPRWLRQVVRHDEEHAQGAKAVQRWKVELEANSSERVRGNRASHPLVPPLRTT